MNAHSNDDLRQAARTWLGRALAEISAAKDPDRERILKAHSRIAGAYAHQGWLDGTVAFNALLAAAKESGLVRETDECYVGGIIRSEMQQGALNPPPLSPSVEAVTAPIGSLPQCEREAGLQPAPQPVAVPDAPIKSALAPIAHTASASLYNESDVKAFLMRLKDHVAALASKVPQDCPVGKMQLVFIQPSTGAVTERRYRVGDVEGMLEDVRVYAHTHNVYIGVRTIRDDAIITQGGRGTFEATGLVYALVVDDDTGVLRNNVAATLEVKTSESRRHKWLLLDTFVGPEAAAALGLRLNRFAGADHCTGRVAHIYRVPGTPNWPNAKKIAEGRKPEPTSLSPRRGKLWSPEAMLNTFPRVDELPQEEGMPQRPVVAPRDDDDAIIEKAMQAANADKFNVLWRGDRAEFNYGHNSRRVRYNKSATGDVSDSMADSVFARMLAFYTSDPAQIDRLMRRSGLYRAKWDSRRQGGTWLSKYVIESAITKHAADAAKEAARADAIRPSVERARVAQLNPQGGPAPGLAAPAHAQVASTGARGRPGVTLDDFYAYMPQHSYIYTPTGEMWPAASVSSRLPPIPLLDKEGKPQLDKKGKPREVQVHSWLDKHRPVEQATWAPGEPMLIRGRLMSDGGWFTRANAACFNLYRPPVLRPGGDANSAGKWLEHVQRVYGDDADHVVAWLAHRVQRPQEKINHALVLGGNQGIGKDTLLEPVKRAIGPWNFSEASPQQMLGRFNGFLKSSILRVSEARDLGDVNRFAFYDHMKAYTAAPPDVLRVDEKHLREHYILNCCGVILTTNYKTNGIYLPADDRRHYVAWSDLTKEDFTSEYWDDLWRWYEDGGHEHVAAYFEQYDLSGFNPKAPPPKTPAFWEVVNANHAPEDAELADLLDVMGNPPVVTLHDLGDKATGELREWLAERRNRRAIPHKMDQAGYVPLRNPRAQDGVWKFNGRRLAVYARKDLSLKDRYAAVNRLARVTPQEPPGS